MKKLLLVLTLVAMVAFLFTGCFLAPDGNGDDGNGDVVVTEPTVDIADSVVLDGKTYVSAGTHDITVTFPEPVTGTVTAYVGLCGGDYSKGLLEDIIAAGGMSVVMFPNEDRTIWSGSADFLGIGPMFLLGEDFGCCASYVFITSGACEDELCLQLPVIVDSCYPYAEIEWEIDGCPCEGCEVTFTSVVEEPNCAAEVECCGDDCSGLKSWAITLYDDDPFDKCCDPSICEVPIDSDSGICPIEFTTKCLTANTTNPFYYAIIELVDEVGLETTYYARFTISGDGETEDCAVLVWEGFENEYWEYGDDCVDWDEVTTDTIGACEADCLFPDFL